MLDASAVLAVLQQEPGADRVLASLPDAVVSAVNFAEVVTRMSRRDSNLSQEMADLHNLFQNILPFDSKQAEVTGLLEPLTKPFGLSLGDRACLALGKSLGAVVLTTDGDWTKPNHGVQIELIRGRPS